MEDNTSVTMTRQRRAILEMLQSVKSHPTADELHQMLRENMPHISLGTVYRNLEMMSNCGLVLKLATSGTQKRFDGCTDMHYHIRCRTCGRVDDIAVSPIEQLDNAAVHASGYSDIAHSLEFSGVCPECAGAGDDLLKNSV